MNHGMYWAINKRFFTNSRGAISDEDLPGSPEKLPGQYEFIGTKKADEIPVWLSMLDRAHRIRQRSGSQGCARMGSRDPGVRWYDPGSGDPVR